MSQAKKPEWTNELKPTDGVPESVDKEMATPTPHELMVAALAERNKKDMNPKSYDVKSKNPKALRVIHDVFGNQISIPPGELRAGVSLYPHTAMYLGKGDLEVKEAVQAPAAA